MRREMGYPRREVEVLLRRVEPFQSTAKPDTEIEQISGLEGIYRCPLKVAVRRKREREKRFGRS